MNFKEFKKDRKMFLSYDDIFSLFIWGIVFGFSFLSLLTNSYAFTPTQDLVLDKVFIQNQNLTPVEFLTMKNLINFTDTNTISNETNLIKNVENKLLQNISLLGKDFADNFTLVNQKINSLDFSQYNDSSQIKLLQTELLLNISQLRKDFSIRYSTSSKIDYNKLYQDEKQKQQDYQTCKIKAPSLDCESIFQIKKSSFNNLNSLDSSQFYNKTQIDDSLSKLQASTMPNLELFAKKSELPSISIILLYLFFIVNLILIVVLAIMTFSKLKEVQPDKEFEEKVNSLFIEISKLKKTKK